MLLVTGFLGSYYFYLHYSSTYYLYLSLWLCVLFHIAFSNFLSFQSILFQVLVFSCTFHHDILLLALFVFCVYYLPAHFDSLYGLTIYIWSSLVCILLFPSFVSDTSPYLWPSYIGLVLNILYFTLQHSLSFVSFYI